MKKLLIFLVLAVGLGTSLTLTAWAVDTDALEQALPESAQEILGDVTLSDIQSGQGVWQKVWDWIKQQGKTQLFQAARSAGVALSVTLLCSVAASSSADGKTPDYVLLGGALAIMGCCAGDIQSFLSQVQTALVEIQDFSKALLPCIAAAATATGHGASGAARYAASALFLDVLMTVANQVVIPMIQAYGVVSTAHAALPMGALSGPVKLLEWLCTTLLTALTTIFTLCLSLCGVVAGAGDKLAGSVTKSVLSAALPVVGSIVADGVDTYLAGAELVQNAIGVFGLGAVLCVCLSPFLGLGLHYLLFKGAAFLAEPFADGRLAGLMGNIATAYGMALGLLGSAGVMLFVSIAVGTGVLTG
jgi:stage III sporulation protein AE